MLEDVWGIDRLTSVAKAYASAPLFPYFSAVSFVFATLALRKEPNGIDHAHRHPIASCVMNYIVASSGAIVVSVMLAKPLLDCVANGYSLLLGTVIWYLVYFSPFDFFYRVCTYKPIYLIVVAIEEVARAKKVMDGVRLAAVVYPSSLVVMALAGMFRGSGKRWIITLFQNLQPGLKATVELQSVSLVTKSSLFLGAILAYNHINPIGDDCLFLLGSGIFLVVLKFSELVWKEVDPFTTPQYFAWRALTSAASTTVKIGDHSKAE